MQSPLVAALCSGLKGSLYIGETKRPLETRIKEHRAATRQGETAKSAIAEHAWGQHPILWEETSVLDQAKNNTTLLIKEALQLSNWSTGRRHSRMLATGVTVICVPPKNVCPQTYFPSDICSSKQISLATAASAICFPGLTVSPF